MSTQDILAELPRLPAEDQELIAKTLRDLREQEQTNSLLVAQKPRVANLHPGAMVMAPDFDDPLPDEFWFGKEARSFCSTRTRLSGGTATRRNSRGVR